MTFSTLGTMASYVPKVGVTGTVDLSTAVVKGAGMDLITPTSVAGTGVTLSGGQVSFSAATSVSVNGCFTSAYDTYRIVMYGGASAIGIGVDARMRLSGTDNTTANSYIRTFVRGVSAAASAAIITGTSFSNIAHTDTDIWSSNFDIMRPAIASMTGFSGMFAGSSNVSSDYVAAFGGRHNQTVAYDGITIIPQSGNITGVMRIYGLRKS
jgi:hypothetical protein